MPRIARNIVEFTVGTFTYRAVFTHQHCEGDKPGKLTITKEEIHARWDRETDRDVFELKRTETEVPFNPARPIIVKSIDPATGRKIDRALRHLTKCEIFVVGREGGDPIGIGEAHCSVRDFYDWRKGIKASFMAALNDIGISTGSRLGERREQQSAFLKAFYEESRKTLHQMAAEEEERKTLIRLAEKHGFNLVAVEKVEA